MKQQTGLPRRLVHYSGDCYETVPVRVYSKKTKDLLFVGTRSKLAEILQVPKSYIVAYIRTKSTFRKKYVFRNGSDSDKQQPFFNKIN